MKIWKDKKVLCMVIATIIFAVISVLVLERLIRFENDVNHLTKIGAGHPEEYSRTINQLKFIVPIAFIIFFVSCVTLLFTLLKKQKFNVKFLSYTLSAVSIVFVILLNTPLLTPRYHYQPKPVETIEIIILTAAVILSVASSIFIFIKERKKNV